MEIRRRSKNPDIAAVRAVTGLRHLPASHERAKWKAGKKAAQSARKPKDLTSTFPVGTFLHSATLTPHSSPHVPCPCLLTLKAPLSLLTLFSLPPHTHAPQHQRTSTVPPCHNPRTHSPRSPPFSLFSRAFIHASSVDVEPSLCSFVARCAFFSISVVQAFFSFSISSKLLVNQRSLGQGVHVHASSSTVYSTADPSTTPAPEQPSAMTHTSTRSEKERQKAKSRAGAKKAAQKEKGKEGSSRLLTRSRLQVCRSSHTHTCTHTHTHKHLLHTMQATQPHRLKAR